METTIVTNTPEQKQSLVDILRTELLSRCKKNPHYSLRAFARSLQVDCSTLSKIMNQKRLLGKKSTENLAYKLGMSPQEIYQLLEFSDSYATNKKNKKNKDDYVQLISDYFQMLSDWNYLAILELMRVDHFVPDTAWVARTLGISVFKVSDAVERMQRLGVLKIEADGKWVELTENKMTTVNFQGTNAALKNLQKEFLELAINCLQDTPIEERDNTSVTFAIDSSKIPEAKEKIKEFRRDLAKYLSRGEKRDSVYNLTVALFPLSKKSI